MRTTLFILVFVMVAWGCDSSVRRFRVTGVQGEFCVPNVGYVAQNVWVARASSVQAPEGFSFGGCHRLILEKDRDECTLPNTFISADVNSLKEHRFTLWRDLKTTADFRGFVNDTGTHFTFYQQSKALVLFNENVSKEWSIWRRIGAQIPDQIMSMQDNDEIVARCSSLEDFPRSAGLGSFGEYGCYRYVGGAKYALEYRFISAQKIPSQKQIDALDKALFMKVNQWHCK